MAGYTRQDTANNIANGNVIDADDFDAEYNAVEAAFNASTGHTHDGTAGEGAPIEKVGPSQDLVVTATEVRAKTTNTLDIGTSAVQFKNGYFDGTLSTDVLSVDETSTLTGDVTASANLSVGGTLTATGSTTLNGAVTLGDAEADAITVTGNINSALIPDASDSRDLGTASKQWRSAWFDGTATIDEAVITSADINGGNIDGTIIGASLPLAITGTTITGTSFVGPLTGDVTGDLTGNADTATTWETARSITLTGDVTGTVASVDGSANISIATTVAANSVALGTDTTGSYVGSLVAGTGVTLTNNSGEGATPTVAIGQAVSTTSDVTFNDVVVSGNLTVSGTTTTASSTNTVISDTLIELGNGTSGTPANDSGIVIERGSADNAFIGFDESADKFKVGTGTFTGSSTGDLTITTGTLVANIEGDVTGNADTATTLETARTIAGQSFDGSANISIAPTDLTDVTATATEINRLDGVTSNVQTQLNTITANDWVTSARIAANAVGASELNVSGNGTSGQFLSSDGDGSFTWTTQTDTDTTYSAGTGMELSGTTFNSLGLGIGQSWASQSRTSDTWYVNNTGKPIQAMYRVNTTSPNYFEYKTSSSGTVLQMQETNAASGTRETQTLIVPDGHYYRYRGIFDMVRELR